MGKSSKMTGQLRFTSQGMGVKIRQEITGIVGKPPGIIEK